jgi:hypothetical protein
MSSSPVASVVVLSDFASGTAQGWEDLRRVLESLARQDVAEPVEYILIESEAFRSSFPAGLRDILPGLRVVFSPATNSYELRNEGVRAARTEVVGTLDGDCTPDRDWVRIMIESLREHPKAAAVSGRTVYAGSGFYSRAAALLERSYIEVGRAGPMRHIANNGAGFRRSVYLRFPLPTDLGVFASQLQSEDMVAAGYELLFEPRMRVTHAFYPAFDSDHRKGIGYGTLRIRMDDPRPPYAWLARLGILSVPIFFVGRLMKGWFNALRYWRAYGVRWYELPAVLALGVFGSAMEVSGMLRAVRHAPPPVTGFR